MFITELFEQPDYAGYRTEKDDSSTMSLKDVRKTRLTLADINRLRQANDVRKIEHALKLKQVSGQYRPPTGQGGGGLPGF